MDKKAAAGSETHQNSRSPFRVLSRLILASGSPRRRRFLEAQGLDFEVIVPCVVEEPLPGETPFQFAGRTAFEKAGSVAAVHSEAWVLGADTVVVLDGKILGKPSGAADAERMLIRLAGRTHEVLTGFCIRRDQDGVLVSRVVSTEVRFASFGRELAAAYVRTGEPLDKAGSYGIQGIGGFLVEKIVGSPSNVVGLPLSEVMTEFLRLGVAVLR